MPPARMWPPHGRKSVIRSGRQGEALRPNYSRQCLLWSSDLPLLWHLFDLLLCLCSNPSPPSNSFSSCSAKAAGESANGSLVRVSCAGSAAAPETTPRVHAAPSPSAQKALDTPLEHKSTRPSPIDDNLLMVRSFLSVTSLFSSKSLKRNHLAFFMKSPPWKSSL